VDVRRRDPETAEDVHGLAAGVVEEGKQQVLGAEPAVTALAGLVEGPLQDCPGVG
jgi:hypothetical protein